MKLRNVCSFILKWFSEPVWGLCLLAAGVSIVNKTKLRAQIEGSWECGNCWWRSELFVEERPWGPGGAKGRSPEGVPPARGRGSGVGRRSPLGGHRHRGRFASVQGLVWDISGQILLRNWTRKPACSNFVTEMFIYVWACAWEVCVLRKIETKYEMCVPQWEVSENV